ncbi:hypothetical protein D1AOALGA4SA_12588 [Olavius algarvensis Delta 1 endosymbiont]|nr:hypothetical protein D1AOALGA4SA_12588 [Olavius algarvensis Delta 1 endosymbiont]
MYSIYFKSTERSESIIIHYSLFNSHFMVVSQERGLWPKNGQSDQRKETLKKRITNIE